LANEGAGDAGILWGVLGCTDEYGDTTCAITGLFQLVRILSSGTVGAGSNDAKSNCPTLRQQGINTLLLANAVPEEVLEGITLSQLTGKTVEIGVGGTFQISGDPLETPAVGGEGSFSLAFDPTGNIALTLNYGGGGGFGTG
jgi:hypothetical protein